MADTKIEAAYKLIYENEKAVAEELFIAVEEFKAKLTTIRDKLTDAGSQSIVAQTLNQYEGAFSINQYTNDTARQYYGLIPVPTL